LESQVKTLRVTDAYDRLKKEILDNRMQPGFQVPDAEIALRLGMSRTPVREALIRLQSEGLVELIPRRGVRVLPISPSDMRDIYQLLAMLEPEAAAETARRGLSEAEAQSLRQATDGMESALAEDDLDRWAQADDRFHRDLLACSSNARLRSFVSTLFDQSHRARAVTLRLREPPWKSTREHRDIIDAMANGDPERTRTIFRGHREQAAIELLAALERCRLWQL